MGGSFFDLFLHLVVALGVVLGTIWLLARVARSRSKGGPFSLRRSSKLTVLERRTLAKGASVALVSVGDKLMLLGITNHSVRLLSELERLEGEDGSESERVVPSLLSMSGRPNGWSAFGREPTLNALGLWRQVKEEDAETVAGQWRAGQMEGVVPLKAWMSTKLEQLRELTVRRS